MEGSDVSYFSLSYVLMFSDSDGVLPELSPPFAGAAKLSHRKYIHREGLTGLYPIYRRSVSLVVSSPGRILHHTCYAANSSSTKMD